MRSTRSRRSWEIPTLHWSSDKSLWARFQKIGEGGFGSVYKEICIVGPAKGQVRAVKIMDRRGKRYKRENLNQEITTMRRIRREMVRLRNQMGFWRNMQKAQFLFRRTISSLIYGARPRFGISYTISYAPTTG
ncbi:hypothetical protein QBC38DRAFT_448099 [Podospora fimiseda]|uniref:Protein kinase domain-containing protein n=1 Tax=Podospora fimiseda TaxID=252190 RepID=A0AAN6YR99_9PEZI|nr:hypothetical protein QBC38DRAFT_448099 [Podospora fimiseda]